MAPLDFDAISYTHYYSSLPQRDPQKWQLIFPELLDDTLKIIEAFGATKIGDGDGEGGEPTLTARCICLNGIGEDSHETFEIGLPDGVSGWSALAGFTKTARKLYDDVVTAILLRACFRLGKDSKGIRGISSDGNWSDWKGGRDLVKKVFPNDETIRPPKIHNDVSYSHSSQCAKSD